MKGGKGGQGRKRSTTRVVKKSAPHEGPKRGAAKRDWGAVVRNDDASDAVMPPNGAGKETPKPRR